MYFGIILWNYIADFPFVSWSYTNLPKCFFHPDWTEFQLSKEKYGSPERPRHLQLSGSGGSIYYAREKSGEEGSGARFPLPFGAWISTLRVVAHLCRARSVEL